MAHFQLFLFPGACSRVTLTALEHIGCDYETSAVDLPNGAQKEPAYLAVNPKGKVPALLVDGRLLTENAAILSYLDACYPDAGLLPHPQDPFERAQILSDLFWLSAGWHPYVRANRAPMRWTTGDVEPVRERGKLLLRPWVDQLEVRLAEQRWWYGDSWSILDVYFYWCYTTAEAGEFSLEGLPDIARHRAEIEALPALQRALAREESTMVEAMA